MTANPRVLVFLTATLVSVPLHADLRIRIKQTYANGRTFFTTEYYKGNLRRIDSDAGYTIIDPINHRSITADTIRREYSVRTAANQPPAIDPSRTVFIESETHDTGERREIFGHQALHLITTERRHLQRTDKPPSAVREITIDGWYLNSVLPFPNHSRVAAVSYLAVLNPAGQPPARPKVQISKRGPTPRGLAISERIADNLLEVQEYSEALLDPALFDVPADFRRVIRPQPGEQLSWDEQLLYTWQRFQDWLGRL